MFPEPARLGVKICGLTSESQARAVIALGADALGINFWPRSKRHLPPEQAAPWLPALHPRTTLVAVLVNAGPELVAQILGENLARILQLHGDETPSQVAALMERGIPVIKALQVRDRACLDAIGRYPCQTLLLDAFNPGHYGGGGATFPWELAVIARDMFPEKRLILSGGLTPQNVRQAVVEPRPAAVDVASGVESSPGVKDLARVAEFIAQARAGAASPGSPASPPLPSSLR